VADVITRAGGAVLVIVCGLPPQPDSKTVITSITELKISHALFSIRSLSNGHWRYPESPTLAGPLKATATLSETHSRINALGLAFV
jgi:hypothetical protein